MPTFTWQYHDEKILFKKYEHTASLIIRNLPRLLAIIALCSIITSSIFFFSKSTTYTGISLFISFIIIVIFLYFIRLFHKETFFVLTNKRAIKSVRNGFFSSHIKELKIENIKQTTANNFWLFAKIFWYGNINVQGPEENTSLYFKSIPKNKKIVMYISRMIDYIQKNGSDTELWEYKENYK